MILSNFHTHTEYCDGLNTMREFADAALAAGFRSLGFSSHCYVPFEGLYHGMPEEDLPAYVEAVNGLKERYAGRLDIYLGLENDEACMCDPGAFDYTIGSVHCIKCGDRYYSVDSWESMVARAIDECFGGDGLAYANAYYGAVSEFASERRADILGHLDVVRRHNAAMNHNGSRSFRFFDEKDPRYRRAAEDALAGAVRSGYIIEVSTGPLSKGFSDEPYPAVFLLERAKELGARVMVNSDAHAVDILNFAFDKMESLLREIGFTERWELTPNGFAAVSL
jgi:histidinol-phosphatase (PHP family)